MEVNSYKNEAWKSVFGWDLPLTLSKMVLCAKYFHIFQFSYNPALPSERLAANVCHYSEAIIDEPVRRCRGPDGGEFNKADSHFVDCLHKLLHLCLPTLCLIHGGDLDRDKDISQHKCWVTHFQMADSLSRAALQVCSSVHSELLHLTVSNLFTAWIHFKAECLAMYIGL